MKPISIYVSLLLILAMWSAPVGAQKLPETIFYTPVEMPVSLQQNYYGLFDTKLLAEDLAFLLAQATGRQFNVQAAHQDAMKGIFLIWDSTRRDLASEEGAVESNGVDYLRITGRYTTGLSYAMYSWLSEQGFRFFLPGTAWTTIPGLKTSSLKKLNKRYKPAFDIRMFTPSGGAPTVKGIDDSGRNIHEWKLWYRRNRMGSGVIRIDGHAGEAFNIANRKEIEADSLLVAPVNGKRRYAVIAKPDPTYPRAVKLFSDWATKQFVSEKNAMPAFLPFKKYYTVDAADGLGYCETPACKSAFASISDQWVFIANHAAKQIRSVDSRAGVSILAYGPRAEIPRKKIETNVHVMIVPGAFQSAGTTASLVNDWSNAHNNISIYDYLNIAVWSFDKPFFNMKQYHHYLKFLRQKNAKGISYETSMSKFGSGVLQYFILRFLCEPFNSIEAEMNEFCQSNFGKAAAPMQSLLKEFYFSSVHLQTNNDFPSFYEDELGRFIGYIDKAEQAEKINPRILSRIGEMKSYVAYLCKFYEWIVELESLKSYVAAPELKSKKVEDLLQFTWQHYDKLIFHNTDLNNLLARYLPADEQQKWNLSSGSNLKAMQPATSEDVNNEFARLRTKFSPLAAAAVPVSEQVLQKLVRHSADSLSISTVDEKVFKNFIYPLEFYASGNWSLDLKTEIVGKSETEANEPVAIVSVESEDYEYLKTERVYLTATQRRRTFSGTKPGYYKIYLSQLNATGIRYTLIPKGVLFFHNKKALPSSGLLFQDASSRTTFDNRFAAVLLPPSGNLIFSPALYSATNTTKFYNAAGAEMKAVEATGRFRFSVRSNLLTEPTLLFFENSQYRWPIVLKNSAPYYFFLKQPRSFRK